MHWMIVHSLFAVLITFWVIRLWVSEFISYCQRYIILVT